MITPDSTFFLFLSTSLALLVVPGPAVLYIIGKSMDQGLKAGLVSVVGIGIGTLVHVIAASIGISAILVASATAFTILKFVGAFYLIYLGIKTLTRKQPISSPSTSDGSSLSKAFIQGVVVNVLNPKTALFFFAFLPQFINPGMGSVSSQIIFLGIVFTAMAIATDSVYALMSSRLSQTLKASSFFIKTQKYFVGATYLLLGLITLASSHPGKK